MQSLQPSTAILIFAVTIFIRIDDTTLMSPCGRRLSGAYPTIMKGYTTDGSPWHAAIYHNIDKLEYQCGGTVIGPTSILTAAHCVSEYNDPLEPSQVYVSLGRFNLRANESRVQSFEAAKIVLHPDYDYRDFSNDIAIVRLPAKAIFNNFVQPICLWKRNKTELSEVAGKDGTVVGWGRMERNNVPDLLQQASMRVTDSWKCLPTNRDVFGSYLSETNFCAGFRNGTNVCIGDSGGSLSFEEDGSFYIRGIVSIFVVDVDSSTESCDSFEYSVFTDVAKFLPWIEDTAEICEKTVQCGRSPFAPLYVDVDTFDVCSFLVRETERNCKIIFTTNTNITTVEIRGKFWANNNLSDAVDKFENLKRIEIIATIKALKRKMFTSLKKIEVLRLSGNEFSAMEANVFDDLTNLLRLELNFNNLQKIPVNLFKEILNLKDIRLIGNKIDVLPEGIFQNNPKLNTIWIYGNAMPQIPEDIFKEQLDLENVDLRSNKLTMLPEGLFRNNAKLKHIFLSYNKITEIPEDIFKEQLVLESIYLDFNELTVLPEGFLRNNRNLAQIVLNNNKIVTIKVDFRNLPRLVYLNLQENVCIDSSMTTIAEMQNEIWRNC